MSTNSEVPHYSAILSVQYKNSQLLLTNIIYVFSSAARLSTRQALRTWDTSWSRPEQNEFLFL